jgi:hypothetical protein
MDKFVGELPAWVPTVLSSLDSAFAIIAGIGAVLLIVYRFGIRRWRKSDGSERRAQTAILDQLACGSPLAYVEARLGHPKYITPYYTGLDSLIEERIYRLPGAWVMVQAPDGVVTAFSITITDADMYYDTAPLTLGTVSVRLGRDTFADAPASDSESLEMYARLATFVRYYDHGCTAAGNQYLWLAFNGVGVGGFSGSDHYVTGSYASRYGAQQGTPPDLSAITVNTITVATYGSRDHLLARGVHGPHPDDVRRG